MNKRTEREENHKKKVSINNLVPSIDKARQGALASFLLLLLAGGVYPKGAFFSACAYSCLLSLPVYVANLLWFFTRQRLLCNDILFFFATTAFCEGVAHE